MGASTLCRGTALLTIYIDLDVLLIESITVTQLSETDIEVNEEIISCITAYDTKTFKNIDLS